jgi:hypothetical protein
MEGNLFARLVQGLAAYDPWSTSAFADHDLDDWASFSDEELECIRAQLSARLPSTAIEEGGSTSGSEEEEEDEQTSALLDDDPNDYTYDARLLAPVTDFQLDSLKPPQLELFMSLLQSTEWHLAVTYRDQLSLAVKALHFSPMRVSFGQLGTLFKRNKGSVYKIYEKTLTEMKPCGRPPALQPPEQEAVRGFIAERWANGTPPTFDAIADFVGKDLGTVLAIDTVRHIIYHLPGIKVVTGKPMERERVEVKPEELVEFYGRLRSVMTGLPADLVFNLDEAGYEEWADRTDIKVIVPESYDRDTVDVPYDRSYSRSSMLVCISAAGSALPPLIIVQRATTEQELYEVGYTPDKVRLAHQENAFINTELFNAWVLAVFLPWVDRRRAELKYEGWAVLILDGCSCHFSDLTADECALHGLQLVILPHIPLTRLKLWTWESLR